MPADVKPATPLPWIVRSLRNRPGECFVQGQRPADMAYAPEIMGDDYEGFGGGEAKDKDAAYIVAACNEYPKLVEDRAKLVAALSDVLDALGALRKPHELTGYGISQDRAEEICAVASLGESA